MKSCRPPLFRKRQFEPVIIITCVRWYLRYPLSARNVESLIAERGLSVDHTTVWRWAPALRPGIVPSADRAVEAKIFHLAHGRDFARVGGKQMYLFRAVDS